MAYRLLESGGFRLLESGGRRLLEARPASRRHFWRILIFDQNKHLVDIPQADVESWQCKSVLNGGAGDGEVVFVRDFNKVGALGYGYTVLIWFWTEGQSMPLDPWYGGTIIDGLDQEQLDARGRVTIHLRGDSQLLDAGIVTSTVTGGIGGVTPMPDAASYMNTIVTTYQPPSFIAPSLPLSMFQLWPLQFDGTQLGQCIDTICKQSLDVNGHPFIWFVKTNRFLQRQVVVELDLNPNWNATAPSFSNQFPGVTCDTYKIETIYRNIRNVIALYGGKDPTTGQQVYGVFQDLTSVSQFTAIEDKLSVPALLSFAAAQSYAQTWLAQNAYPQAQGSARILDPDPTIVVGRWMQFLETPQNVSQAAVVKQVRIAEIDVQCNGQRVEMKVTTNSPTPYLDAAIYRLGLNVNASASIGIKPIPVNTQQLYVIAGGVVAAASSSPAKINISACECVFPTLGLETIPAVTNLTVADSGTSATGDGDYTVYATSSTAFTIVKGLPASPSATQQLIAKIAVVAGTAFVTDARTLMAQPAIDTTQQPVVTSVTLGASPNNGAGAYDQQVTFTLASPFGTTANTGLAVLQLGWRVNGATNPISQSGADIVPNATGVGYTGTVLGIGAGSAVDLYVRGVDTHGRATAWTFLVTTSGLGVVGQTIGILIPTFTIPAIAGPITAAGAYTIYDGSIAGTIEHMPGAGIYTVTGSIAFDSLAGFAYTTTFQSGGTITNGIFTPRINSNNSGGLTIAADFSFNIPGGASFYVVETVTNPSGWSCSQGQVNISAVRTST